MPYDIYIVHMPLWCRCQVPQHHLERLTYTAIPTPLILGLVSLFMVNDLKVALFFSKVTFHFIDYRYFVSQSAVTIILSWNFLCRLAMNMTILD